LGGLPRTEGPKFEAEGGGGVFKVAASPPPARDLGSAVSGVGVTAPTANTFWIY